jgi:hypothetical protein
LNRVKESSQSATIDFEVDGFVCKLSHMVTNKSIDLVGVSKVPDNDQITNDPSSGLLGALLGGHPVVQDHMQNTGQSLDQIMASLSNSANPSSNSSSPSGSFADILGSLMGGARQAGNGPMSGTGGDALGSILGSLLGGGTPPGGQPAQNAPGTGDNVMGAILGSFLGGGVQDSTPSASALGSNSFLAPIVDAIAARIGIQPQIAQTVVSFALTQLIGAQGNKQLAHTLAKNGTVSQGFLRTSGLVNQLCQQTGMDSKTATKSLQKVLEAFGTQMAEVSLADRQQNLQSWLESK